ncbi:MAG: glycosyltransferase family 4 protein [Chloroflexota bacterium]|nr:glycosyltransferase family 4 protein [Chloroflexota bacterium]
MRSGVGRAIESILKCLGEMDHPFTTINVYTPQPLDDTVKLPHRARNVVLPSRLHPGLWEQSVLLKAHGAKNVLFCPSYVMPLFARCPTLLAHHGSYEGYKDAAQAYSLWTRSKARVMYDLSAHRATIVSTVSEYSKRDMAHYYRLDPERIHVIPEGVDTRLFRPIEDESLLSHWRTRLFGQDVPFILYVGKPTRRRNLPNLLRAFQRLKQEHKIPHKLLLVGSSMPGTVFEKEIQERGLREHVVELGYASHEELVVCYNACDVFIYPSSYEGFGMPVLEAMACGTPVIALNNTAFPEFAGGVARLLPDANVDTLADGITQLLFDREQRETMAREGPRRAKKYDWHIVTGLYLEQLLKLAIPENAIDPIRLPDL